jgi:hypothetical protein
MNDLIERLRLGDGTSADHELLLEAADALEALAQTQEPVAWGVFDDNLHDMFFAKEEAQEMVRLKGDGSTVKPLYTTPPQRKPQYDKTKMNCFVQDLYDKKMQEGKHGHYETMFHVVHQAIKKVPPQRTWVGLTDEEIWSAVDRIGASDSDVNPYQILNNARAIEAKLKAKNFVDVKE